MVSRTDRDTGRGRRDHARSLSGQNLAGHHDQKGQAASTLDLDVVVEGVVWNVAVKDPFPRFLGRPDHVVPLPGSDVDHIRLESRRRRQRYAIASDDGKRTAVHVHRMNNICSFR